MNEMQQVFEELSSYPIFYFATVDGDTPTQRPLGLRFMYNDTV